MGRRDPKLLELLLVICTQKKNTWRRKDEKDGKEPKGPDEL
jgi:hypothetical protein